MLVLLIFLIVSLYYIPYQFMAHNIRFIQAAETNPVNAF